MDAIDGFHAPIIWWKINWFFYFSALEKIIWLKYSSNWAKDDFGSSTLYKTGSTCLCVSKLKTVCLGLHAQCHPFSIRECSFEKKEQRERDGYGYGYVQMCGMWVSDQNTVRAVLTWKHPTHEMCTYPFCFLSFPFFLFFVFLKFHLHSTINFLICWLW